LAGASNELRVRVEIMGSQKCGTVGKSQPVLVMSIPITSTRTRSCCAADGGPSAGLAPVALEIPDAEMEALPDSDFEE
jgi:hypothetical protein